MGHKARLASQKQNKKKKKKEVDSLINLLLKDEIEKQISIKKLKKTNDNLDQYFMHVSQVMRLGSLH